MNELPQDDLCDEDDPLAAAVLGLGVLLDELATELHDDDADGPRDPIGEIDLAVLGLLSARRSLRWLIAGLAAGAEETEAPRSSMGASRPGDLLR